MKYDFNTLLERENTGALKLEALQERWGRTDLLPMWVADMDFATPPAIVNSIKERLDKKILGYTVKTESWSNAIINWQKKTSQLANFQRYVGFCSRYCSRLISCSTGTY